MDFYQAIVDLKIFSGFGSALFLTIFLIWLHR